MKFFANRLGERPRNVAIVEIQNVDGEKYKRGEVKALADRLPRHSRMLAHSIPRRSVSTGRYLGSSTSGSPFFELPMITTLAFALVASFSVASMPFHSSSCGLMPAA